MTGPLHRPLPPDARPPEVRAPEIYLDHAAGAPLVPAARDALLEALDAGPGNPGSSHGAGRAARRRLEDAREDLAATVGIPPDELVLTSGATEGMRLAILGLATGPALHVVASRGAHPTTQLLLEAVAERIHWLPLDRDAGIDPESELPADADLLVLSWVESVTGARRDVPRLAARAREQGLVVVVDATQAVGRVETPLGDSLDAVVWSAHKLGGPVGIGALRLRSGCGWRAPWGPASQERGRRAGTEAVPLAASFAAAQRVALHRRPGLSGWAEETFAPLDRWAARERGVEVFGDPAARVPTTRLLLLHGCRGDGVLAALDREGIRVSTGTACASGARTPAEVLLAAGRTPREALSALRISIGWGSTRAGIRALVEALCRIVPRARSAAEEA